MCRKTQHQEIIIYHHPYKQEKEVQYCKKKINILQQKRILQAWKAIIQERKLQINQNKKMQGGTKQ